ncbi:DUF58 domain-containing protein [Aeromicrobium sp.]|uniref:DUF58 domain-containing protein n=1 Tax=Aeromicrobium sp. TaxID=1871063 RepID=UPI003D6A8A3E
MITVRALAVTRRGGWVLLVAVNCFVLAAALSLPALLYTTGLLLGLVVLGALYLLAASPRARVDRTFAPPVLEPDLGSRVTLRFVNRARVPLPASRWEDHLPAGLGGAATGQMPTSPRTRLGRAGLVLGYDVRGQRRGRHVVGPLQLENVDPFGLVRRRHVVAGTHSVIVLPRRRELAPLGSLGLSDDGSGRPAPQHAGNGADDVIARTYLAGDAVKRLNWKATAHRGELMVRQEERQVNPRAAVYLDCDPSTQGTALDRAGEWEHSPMLEWSVVAAASVMTHLVGVGCVVALRSSDQTIDRSVGDGHDTLSDAMLDLAVVEPAELDVDAVEPAERSVVLVTGHLDQTRADHWIRVLGRANTVHAFVAATTRPEALARLDGTRWSVVTYRTQDNQAERWLALDRAVSRALG